MQQPKTSTTSCSKLHKLHGAFNNAEKQEPFNIILRFFNTYTLPEIREGLNDWFFDTLQEDNSDIKQHALLYNDIQKMIEAVYAVASEVCKSEEVLPG